MFAKPSSAASPRTAAIVIRAVPRSGAPRATSSSIHSARGRPRYVYGGRAGVWTCPCAWRGRGTRGRGEMCESVVFPAMCPPELHEIAKKAPETFSSDHVETRGGYATWGGECTVVFARPCDAASARPTAIFIRAAPRSRAPRATSSSLQITRKRPQPIADARAGMRACTCSFARRGDRHERRNVRICVISRHAHAEMQ